MAYEQSMREYGNDKPDLRFGMKHVDLTRVVAEHRGAGVPMWSGFAQPTPGQIVKAMVVPGSAGLSRTETDKLEEIAKGMGAKGLARAKVDEQGNWTQSPLAKSIAKEARAAVNAAAGAQAGDLILFGPSSEQIFYSTKHASIFGQFDMAPPFRRYILSSLAILAVNSLYCRETLS